MMTVPPFQENEGSEQNFILALKEIRKARSNCQQHLAGETSTNNSEITDFMREMRGSIYKTQKRFYVENRLLDQKLWYSRKAKFNARSGNQWFWLIVVFQFIAVIPKSYFRG